MTLEESRCVRRWFVELLHVKSTVIPVHSHLLELGDQVRHGDAN